MSNQIEVVDNNLSNNISALDEIYASPSSTSMSVARVTQVHTAIMGEVQSNGKTIKAEVIPVGWYKYTKDDTLLYSESVDFILLDVRQQLTRWNSEAGNMEKTELSHNLQKDLKDMLGGFNLGRKAGYLDWKKLDEETKSRYRLIKRIIVHFGLISINNPVDEEGNPVGQDILQEFCVMDIKNKDSIEQIKKAVGKHKAQLAPPSTGDEDKDKLQLESWRSNKRTPPLFLTGLTNEMAGGGTFATVKADVGLLDGYASYDTDIVHVSDFISYVNKGICDKWEEAQSAKEDADLVAEFVDV
jgi:hypothetical protein